MNIEFTQKEKIEIIKAAGYTVKEVEVGCSQPSYHNDMNYWKETVYGVFENEKTFQKPIGYGGVGELWVNRAFDKIVHGLIYNLLIEATE